VVCLCVLGTVWRLLCHKGITGVVTHLGLAWTLRFGFESTLMVLLWFGKCGRVWCFIGEGRCTRGVGCPAWLFRQACLRGWCVLLWSGWDLASSEVGWGGWCSCFASHGSIVFTTGDSGNMGCNRICYGWLLVGFTSGVLFWLSAFHLCGVGSDGCTYLRIGGSAMDFIVETGDSFGMMVIAGAECVVTDKR